MNDIDTIVPLRMPLAASVIAEQLRARILDGSLAAMEHINEAQLAARFNVSRGPVREAVQRLVQEGLLKSTRNRGTFVTDLGPADIEDVYKARGAIEKQSARLTMCNSTDELIHDLKEILAAMARALDEQDWSTIAMRDLEFHQSIVSAAGSHRLSRMFTTLAAETLICIRKTRTVYKDKAAILHEHQGLLNLIEAGDLEGYLTAIDDHMNNSVVMLTAAQTLAASER